MARSEKQPAHSGRSFVHEGNEGESSSGTRRRGLQVPPELLQQVRERQPEALGAFFDLTFQFLFGLVYRLLGERSAAEDATQEIFLKIHRAADRIDPTRDPVPWLTTIAYNHCRDIWRSSARRMEKQSSSLDEHPELSNLLPGREPTPEGHALAREREALVRRAIAELPEPQREVVLLHDYQGMTHEEVAKVVGASHAAVRKRYSRALSALGELLERWMNR